MQSKIDQIGIEIAD
jgi:ferredoxin-fold anticodon binding domain-containing protein